MYEIHTSYIRHRHIFYHTSTSFCVFIIIIITTLTTYISFVTVSSPITITISSATITLYFSL